MDGENPIYLQVLKEKRGPGGPLLSKNGMKCRCASTNVAQQRMAYGRMRLCRECALHLLMRTHEYFEETNVFDECLRRAKQGDTFVYKEKGAQQLDTFFNNLLFQMLKSHLSLHPTNFNNV